MLFRSPDIFTNDIVALNFNGGGNNSLLFSGDTCYSFNLFFGWQPLGTYTYSIFSPGGAMIQLDFYGTGSDWLQFNFKSAGAGNFYVNELDATNNLIDTLSGQFQLQ